MPVDASTAGEATPADLTARARVRNAALAQFAERGSTGITIRGVARAASVSPSLVQHHFGTKDGLREACDEYVAQQLRQGVERGVTEQPLADPAFVAETHRTAPVILRYLARALTDGWPSATTALFDDAVTLTEAHLTAQGAAAGQATRTRAAVFTAMKLGVVVLHEQLSRALAIDTMSPDGMSQVSEAVLDIVSPALIGEGLAEAAHCTCGPGESPAALFARVRDAARSRMDHDDHRSGCRRRGRAALRTLRRRPVGKERLR